MTAPSTDHVSPGEWQPFTFDDPFCDLIGPLKVLHTGVSNEPVRFGLLIEPQHCNRLRYCHGGLLSTFLDIALGFCAIAKFGHAWGGPTIHLSVDFLQGAPVGDWIESRVVVEHATRSLLFVNGSVIGSLGKIATAHALFKQPRPQA